MCSTDIVENRFSIDDFKLNGNDTNVNRWHFWEQIDQKEASSKIFFDRGLLMVTIDDNLQNLNPNFVLNEAWVSKFTTYNNNGIENIYLPARSVECYEVRDVNCLALLIRYQNDLCGYVLVKWERLPSNRWEIKNNLKVRCCVLCGGGSYYPWISLNDKLINFNNNVAGTVISNVQSQILCKCRSKPTYDKYIEHDIGFCCERAIAKWTGDHKFFGYLFGIASASVSHSCAYCLTGLEDRQQLPTPQTRCWKSRTRVHLEQSWIQSLGKNKQSIFNLTKPPLLVSSPSSLSLAVMHQIQGPAARLMTIVKQTLNTHNINPQFETCLSLICEIEHIKSEKQQYVDSLQWCSNPNNEDVFDEKFLQEKESNLNLLKKQISVREKEIVHKEKQLSELEKEPQSKVKSSFVHMCDELKIKPWHHKGDTMHGPSVKKFIYGHEIVMKYLKQCDDDQLLKLMEPCLIRLKYITKCFWTKSTEIMSDECVNYLKWNLIEWDHIYHRLINLYGGGKGYRLGNKWHVFYHSYEWIEYWRISPAWMDDERVEQYNVHVSKFLPIYACFGGHLNLKRMMNKMWREFVLG